ncbi:thiosulfate/3-mercaptopyruvate sulfurtransferase 1, mitochondrial-like isoform X2 [Olea europaea var. sylvestris]|uniref:thiosulfate/3-mercaptopyruvate sulfurtransferase 1, mitochondrial-like isoform X2 n=1 Tax=Olea europaea var. sylvestris TaxID=158386 RepID=UPI000C1D671A|nr:thiosulfate/3-mercaptopyruvate sulfurtransferase 1, mitochondrial-like isoform X2 [Olea europaea var. sylvestris]
MHPGTCQMNRETQFKNIRWHIFLVLFSLMLMAYQIKLAICLICCHRKKHLLLLFLPLALRIRMGLLCMMEKEFSVQLVFGGEMFRVFGHDRIWVLDGGLPRWRASGFDVESSASSDAIFKASAASEAIEKVYQGQHVGPFTFETRFQPHLVWTLEQVKKNVEEKTYQHVDARSKARFDGAAPEPRKGIRSGHVPGSRCIPFAQMLDGSQTLSPAVELKKRFEQEGITLDKPVITSCGTGVTACILALGLHRLGKTDVPVYDGSWTEWGAKDDTPVESSEE